MKIKDDWSVLSTNNLMVERGSVTLQPFGKRCKLEAVNFEVKMLSHFSVFININIISLLVLSKVC